MWERIQVMDDVQNFQDSRSFSHRLKVPGGWLVRTVALAGGAHVSHMFVPDKKHTWKLEVASVGRSV